MKNLRGAAANITRPDKITPKEREAIIEMSKLHPTSEGDIVVAEKFGRSFRTVRDLRYVWQREAGIRLPFAMVSGKCPVPDAFRQRAALDFAKQYGKPFTIKTAAEFMGAYSAYPALFRRLAIKGYFTTKTVKLHVRCANGVMRRTKMLIITPTAQLLEE